MFPQTLIIANLKMYKISDKIINFIHEVMENWKMELGTGGQTVAELKFQRRIFLRDSLLPQRFVIARMPLNHIFTKFTEATNSQSHQERLITL